jgi:hypothetical protein
MAEFGGALDAYLEAPYVDAARREAEFEKWCEATGTDPDDDGSWEAFEDAWDEEPEPPDDHDHDHDPRDDNDWEG